MRFRNEALSMKPFPVHTSVFAEFSRPHQNAGKRWYSMPQLSFARAHEYMTSATRSTSIPGSSPLTREAKKREPAIEVGFRCPCEYGRSPISSVSILDSVFKCVRFWWTIGKKNASESLRFQKKTHKCGQKWTGPHFQRKTIWQSPWWVTRICCYTGRSGVLCFPHPAPLYTPPSVTSGSKFKEIRVLYSQQGRLQLLDCTVCPTYLTSLHPECVAHSVDKSRHFHMKDSLQAG